MIVNLDLARMEAPASMALQIIYVNVKKDGQEKSAKEV